MNLVNKLLGLFLGLVLLFLSYTLFIFVPVLAYTESECLKNGYDKTHVTLALDKYCSKIEGVVTVKIQKQ